MTAMLRLLAFLSAAMVAAFGSPPAETAVRKGRGLRLGRGTDPVFCGTATVNGRRVHVFSDGTTLPVIAGGDGPNDPPAPPAPPAPDLAGLQQVIDDAKRTGQTEATTTVLKALGFEKLEDAQTFVTAKREAETAQLTEIERREKAAADREAAAAAKETAAADRALKADIRAALLTAGAPAEHVADLIDLVKVAADADEAAIKTAVEAKKTQFPALFAGAGGGPAPSGAPGGTPPKPPAPKGALEAGRQRAQAMFNKQTSAA